MKTWFVLASVCIISLSLGLSAENFNKEIMETEITQNPSYTARDSEIGSASCGFASNFPSSLAVCSRALPLAPDKKFEEPSCHLPILESFPVYLYKILSLRNWQATQNRETVALSAEDEAFIHFSTEDQLERILKKYWSDAEQVVILKIEASKLKGRLIYEANPGGTSKYFHLYEGFIPFSSIVESKIVYQKTLPCCERGKLDIVQVGDPVLRTPARELSLEEILSPEIQSLIEAMKATMRAAPGVGLAAPQIGKSIQLAVIEDVDHSHLNAEQRAQQSRLAVPFHVIINPRIYVEEHSDEVEFFEGCLSMPKFVGIVPRAESVRVECLNERAEPVVIHAKGWYARILQHEIDHLKGILYVDRVILPSLMTEENYVRLWKGKSIKEIQDVLKQPQKLVFGGA